MQIPTPLLPYGTVPRRRVWLRIVAPSLLAIATIALGAWYYRQPLKAWADERYHRRQFEAAFDRAVRELNANDDTWIGSANPPGQGGLAKQRLQALVSLSPPNIAARSGTAVDRVLFECTGKSASGRWIVFAVISQNGLETYSFVRENPSVGSYDLLPWTYSLWNSHPTISVRQVENLQTTIHSKVAINGGDNEIIWSIPPNIYTNSSAIRVGSPHVAIVAVPVTGWTTPGGWWPAEANCRLIDGPAPDRVVPMSKDGHAIAFLPDGRIAVATRTLIAFVNAMTSETSTLPLPGGASKCDVFAFSGDGNYLFVGGMGTPSWLVESLSGRAGSYKKIQNSYGQARVDFPDNRSLIFFDNTRRFWTGLKSQESENLDKLRKYYGAFGAAGDLIAVQDRWKSALVLDYRKDLLIGTFPLIQGVHQLSISQRGQYLAMKGQSGLRFLDVATQKVIWDHDGDVDLHTYFSRIKWSEDGLRGTTAGNQFAYVWNLREPRWVARFKHGCSGSQVDAAISPDGHCLAVCGSESTAIAYWHDIDNSLSSSSLKVGKGQP